MCGIVGWLLPADQTPGPEALEHACSLIHHRGPDAGGYEIVDVGRGWTAGLGNRRLAILDLSPSGEQPYRRGQVTAVYNGEIYNFVELRQELQARGATFRSTCDTEVLVAAYQEWGLDFLHRLNGMFGFMLWDAAEQRLVVARDAFGEKPLLYRRLPSGGYLFGSEVQPLLDFPGVPPATLDVSTLSHYLQLRYVPGPDTLFTEVKKLPPGHYAVVSPEGLDIQPFFRLPVLDTPVRESLTMEEGRRELADALEDSIRIRLRSDAPFGAFLSGGLDSSTIVALMSRQLDRPVKTFSVGFEERRFSELAYARQVAEHYRTDHTELVVSSKHVVEEIEKAVRHRGAPVSEPSDIPILLLSREARRTVKMVLTGEGSDELLGGYPKYRALRFTGPARRLTPHALDRALAGPIPRRLPKRLEKAQIVLRAFAQAGRPEGAAAWFASMSQDDADALLADRIPRSRFAAGLFPDAGTELRSLQAFDQLTWLPDNLLERADRMMMAESIEGRIPFLDPDLARVAASFPARLLVGEKGGKSVLRHVMRELLPPEILQRPKVGFKVPVDDWFRNELRPMTLDLLRSPDSRIAPLFDRAVLDARIDDHMAGRINTGKMIWSFLNLELFMREFGLTA